MKGTSFAEVVPLVKMEGDILDGWKGCMNNFRRIYQDINEQTKRESKKVVQFCQSGTEKGKLVIFEMREETTVVEHPKKIYRREETSQIYRYYSHAM